MKGMYCQRLINWVSLTSDQIYTMMDHILGTSPLQIIWLKRPTKPHGILKWTTPYKTSKCQITVIVIKYIIHYVYIGSGFIATINIEPHLIIHI